MHRECCPICGRDDVELLLTISYRTAKTRGLLCRQDNTAIGTLHDSPTRLRQALHYLLNPPAARLKKGLDSLAPLPTETIVLPNWAPQALQRLPTNLC
jgi:hypothetical protein